MDDSRAFMVVVTSIESLLALRKKNTKLYHLNYKE